MITAVYPVITQMVNMKNYKGLKDVLRQSINLANLMLIPSTIGVFIFSKEIIWVIFGRGAFDIASAKLAGTTLMFYSIGFLGKGLREIISRPFYSIQDMKTPMINATFGIIINIILNFYLSKIMGLSGLALA